MKKFYKWIKPEGHNGMVYKEGLNTDIMPFNPSGNCEPGGIYFSRDSTFAFIRYGEDLYEVTPVGEVYENPCYPKKWKAHKVKLKFVGKRSDPKVIKRLIKEGAGIHADNEDVLMTAAHKGHYFVVRLLLKLGAHIHARDDYALRVAAEQGNAKVVKLLLKNGADVHSTQNCALRNAASVDTIKLLLDAGADIHALYDQTLRSAVYKGSLEIVKLLLKRGASANTACKGGALGLAQRNGFSEIVSLLEKAMLKESGSPDSTLE